LRTHVSAATIAGTAPRTHVSAAANIRTATADIRLAAEVGAVVATVGGYLETAVCAAAVANDVADGIRRAAE
jgi:hypothetical protein